MSEYVEVKVEYLRHLETFLNRMVEQGTHVHAKVWGLVAAIPDDDTPPVDSISVATPVVQSADQSVLELYDSLPAIMTEVVYSEDGFGVGFKVVHPLGVDCVFPPSTKRCSCGRSQPLSVPDATEPDPSPS